MTAPTSARDARIGVAQIFLQDAEMHHREDPLVTGSDTTVSATQAELELESRESDNGKQFAVRLRASCKAEDATYHYSVAYVAILNVEHEGEINEELRERIIAIGGSIAYPFVRETVANLSMRSKFGPTWLSLVNFGELVANKKRKAQSG